MNEMQTKILTNSSWKSLVSGSWLLRLAASLQMLEALKVLNCEDCDVCCHYVNSCAECNASTSRASHVRRKRHRAAEAWTSAGQQGSGAQGRRSNEWQRRQRTRWKSRCCCDFWRWKTETHRCTAEKIWMDFIDKVCSTDLCKQLCSLNADLS